MLMTYFSALNVFLLIWSNRRCPTVLLTTGFFLIGRLFLVTKAAFLAESGDVFMRLLSYFLSDDM